MDVFFTLVLLIISGIRNVLMDTLVAKEYCQWENFNVSCPRGQVILMEKAHYGRMQLGSCITKNDHIGCSVDVLNVMDSMCSGKEHCLVEIPNESFHRGLISSCAEMIAYLEAMYSCIGGNSYLFNPSERDLLKCGPNNPIHLPYAPEGYIPGTVNSNNCHLRVEVHKGQTIEVHLYEFNLGARLNQMKYDTGYDGGENVIQDTAFCEIYAQLTDRESMQEFTVCASNTRHSLQFTTSANSLDILMLPEAERQHNFMLSYRAKGCPDITPPHEAQVIRRGNKATIKCDFTGSVWHIVCKDTSWIGVVSNCSAEPSNQLPETTWMQPGTNATSLIIAVCIGILIGAICGFIMLAMVMLYRKRRKRSFGRATNLKLNTDASNCPNYGVFNSNHCTAHQLGTDRNYTHIWRLQRTPPPPAPSNDQYEHNMYTMKPMSADTDSDRDYEGQTLPTVTYVCRHNKTYEKPMPQIISDSQRPNRPMQTGTMDIDRKRLWVNTGQNKNNNECSDAQHVGTSASDSINDSGVET